MRRWSSAAILALAFAAVAQAHEAAGRAHYIGNEGILVEHGESKILIDAFYSNSYGQYVLVSEEVREAQRAGEAPWDGVDALFVSHVHGDHFTARPAFRYLRAQPTVRFFGPPAAVDALRELAPDDRAFSERLQGIDLTPGQAPSSLEAGALHIEAVAIPHSGGERMAHIRNLSFRVTLDDELTVLHLGDATIDAAEFERQDQHWQARRSQAAFPPYWLFADPDGRAIIERFLNADQVIGVHVPARASGNGEAWREQLGADLFTDPGEIRELGAPGHE